MLNQNTLKLCNYSLSIDFIHCLNNIVCAVCTHSLLALLFDLIIQLLSVSELSHLCQSAYYKVFGQ